MDTPLGQRTIYQLSALEKIPGNRLKQMPYCIRVLLEACLRHYDGYVITEDTIKALACYNAKQVGDTEIPFKPGRVVLQDFTGVPAVVDLAAMRSAMKRMNGDPQKVNPLVPCDLVIDHSVQVDAFGSAAAFAINAKYEFERNNERYEFLKWGQKAFNNFRVVPPATGIVHQVNLEYLAKVTWDQDGVLFPDSLVGTDSHTTMINGLGVVGWGVGGIEAEAVMLGQPIYMLIPEVVGFEITGKLPEGTTATDLVLTITQMLRKHGVVNKFVEFYGPGLKEMTVANRATIGNMAPEYGATIGFFPVDNQTLAYMRLSGRDETLIQTVEQYSKAQGLWHDDSRPVEYTSTLKLDLSTVEPSVAGPKRPQDRISLSNMKNQWERDLSTTFARPDPSTTHKLAVVGSQSKATTPAKDTASANCIEPGTAVVDFQGHQFKLHDGAVVIAAITSCTNTSNPEVMIGAGLVAKKAVALGLQVKPWVKTSLAPGSKVVTEYLTKSGLNQDLDALGFNTVGYGCTTCIGNSGPVPEPISKAINACDIVASAVLSGNRNFEGRINPDVKANYLASPPLVVAYAIAGTVDINLATDPIGQDKQGRNVYLKDIWPTQAEILKFVHDHVTLDQFRKEYANVFEGSDEWKAIPTSGGALFEWNEKSTYVQEPPFFEDLPLKPEAIKPIKGARCLVKVGDSVTTDHISPAGSIKKDSPAGKYLQENGVSTAMFNSYGSRRGNDRVMTRGTFANIRVKNQLAPGTEGGWTTDYTDQQVKSIYDASINYKKKNIPLVVLAGKDYGMGSSRDWAAKGTFLLGAKAVIADSFERIHRSNLVGMGVLPLCYKNGQTAASLGLTGTETFDIQVDDNVKPHDELTVTATSPEGKKTVFTVICRIDTPVEVEYYRNGGILHTVLRKMAQS